MLVLTRNGCYILTLGWKYMGLIGFLIMWDVRISRPIALVLSKCKISYLGELCIQEVIRKAILLLCAGLG